MGIKANPSEKITPKKPAKAHDQLSFAKDSFPTLPPPSSQMPIRLPRKLNRRPLRSTAMPHRDPRPIHQALRLTGRTLRSCRFAAQRHQSRGRVEVVAWVADLLGIGAAPGAPILGCEAIGRVGWLVGVVGGLRVRIRVSVAGRLRRVVRCGSCESGDVVGCHAGLVGNRVGLLVKGVGGLLWRGVGCPKIVRVC